MAIEVEQKYRLNPEQFNEFEKRLDTSEAVFEGERFEKNVLYSNDTLDLVDAYVRLRVFDGRTEITFKQKMESDEGFKTQLEYETSVGSFEEIEKIIEHLGVSMRLMYEKRRKIWRFRGAEVVLDELPFGLYMEIEGSPGDIEVVAEAIGAETAQIEHRSYPLLTSDRGIEKNGAIVSVFKTG